MVSITANDSLCLVLVRRLFGTFGYHPPTVSPSCTVEDEKDMLRTIKS